LFSTDRVCRRSALESLFLTPQNNLRVFVNGAVQTAVEQHMQEELIRMLLNIIEHTGVLERILDTQRLDVHDVEAIYYLYCRLHKLRTFSGTSGDARLASPSVPASDLLSVFISLASSLSSRI